MASEPRRAAPRADRANSASAGVTRMRLWRSTGMTLRRALLITVAPLVVSVPVALAQYAVPPSTGTSRACTEIGCESGVFVRVSAYFAAHATAQRVRVCALGRCRSTRRGEHALLVQPLVLPVAREEAITITVTAFGRDGGLVLRRKLIQQLRKVQPNGPQCQPVCFQANLLLSRRGVLTGRRA